jgi:predicted lipoprotein with Yx(FWY)xxD motif
MVRPHLKLLALAVAAALIVAGCGGGDSTSESAYGGGETSSTSQSAGNGGRSYGEGSTTAAPPSGDEGKAATVSVGSVPELGRVLVSAEGFTLYDFHKDKGSTSSCYGPCANAWPPLMTDGAPQPSNGASASKLGTTRRNDGTVQVTYAGHPLYTYSLDTKPGDAKGNDVDAFGAEWYALTPQGGEPKD